MLCWHIKDSLSTFVHINLTNKRSIVDEECKILA